MMTGDRPVINTDRELWRERDGDYYADSIHVTEGGGIGINCGGTVIVRPLKEWHKLALLAAVSTGAPPEIERLREVCAESNAVCICGCPADVHENYGDEGECCENPTHECLRTSKAVYAVIHQLRQQLASPAPGPARAETKEAADE
jgi:hypothetical protein